MFFFNAHKKEQDKPAATYCLMDVKLALCPLLKDMWTQEAFSSCVWSH